MINHSLTAERIFLNASLLLVIAAIVTAFPARAIARPQDPSERQRAKDLYESNNFVAALPLLEKVAAANPKDVEVLSMLGFVLYANVGSTKDPAARQQIWDRARTVLMRARELGDDSNLTNAVLEALKSKSPTDLTFSNIKEAEAAIREGENAFVHGEMDKALAAYKRALAIDPRLYDAALYAGDVEFKKGYNSTDPQFRSERFDQAGVWFARAIAINPDRETAYRYWGDALDAQGKTNEARDKFVEAIVAEPYNRSAYVGLTQWGERHKVSLGHLRVDIPSNVTSKKPGEINITVDDLALKGSDSDGSAAWMMYGIARAGWMDKKEGGRSDRFARAYPDERAYRHSLAEEADALHMVAVSVETQTKENRVKKLTPSLENLMRLNNAGLLEPFILFVLPDREIVRDYIAYRKAHRDKLKRYWLEFVIATP